MFAHGKRLIGRIIEGYLVVRQIGSGGASLVFLGQNQEHPDDKVAIKVLMPPTADPKQVAEFHARFLREAETLNQRLHHPHILPVLKFGEDEEDNIVYMFLPYITGGTLAQRLAVAPMDFALISNIITQLAEALDYAHNKKIIHRDIKPSNVLLDEQNYAYLVDFGIAKIYDSTMTTLTDTGRTIGTPEYMSPEQAKGESVTFATDIYSLGMLAYHAVTGRLPFPSATIGAMLVQVITMSPISPLTFRPDLPPATAAVILRALAKAPQDRFLSATDFAHAFMQSLARDALREDDVLSTEVFDTPPTIELAQALPKDVPPSAVVLPQSIAPPESPPSIVAPKATTPKAVFSANAALLLSESSQKTSSVNTAIPHKPSSSVPPAYSLPPILAGSVRIGGLDIPRPILGALLALVIIIVVATTVSKPGTNATINTYPTSTPIPTSPSQSPAQSAAATGRIIGVGAFFSSNDNLRHAIIATSDEKVFEVYYNPNSGISQPIQITQYSAITSVAGFYSPDVAYRQVIIATQDGMVHEAYFQGSHHIQEDILGTFSDIVSVSAFYTPDDSKRNVVVATHDGDIHLLTYNAGSAINARVLAHLPGVISVAALYADGGDRHIIVAANNGDVHDIRYKGNTAPSDTVIHHYNGIIAAGGLFSKADTLIHALVATQNGEVHDDAFDNAGVSNDTVIASFTGITSIAGFYSPDVNYSQAIIGTSDGVVHEVYFTPGASPKQDIITTFN